MKNFDKILSELKPRTYSSFFEKFKIDDFSIEIEREESQIRFVKSNFKEFYIFVRLRDSYLEDYEYLINILKQNNIDYLDRFNYDKAIKFFKVLEKISDLKLFI